MLRYVYRRFHGFLFLWRLRDNISWGDDELFGGNCFPFALDWNIQLTRPPQIASHECSEFSTGHHGMVVFEATLAVGEGLPAGCELRPNASFISAAAVG
jgi:hypothetical protein